MVILAFFGLTLAQGAVASSAVSPIATTPGGTVFLLDRATIRDFNGDGIQTREAILKTDNHKSALKGPTAQVGAVALFRVHCGVPDYQTVWTRILQRNGQLRLLEQASLQRPFTRPTTGSFEARIVEAICKA